MHVSFLVLVIADFLNVCVCSCVEELVCTLHVYPAWDGPLTKSPFLSCVLIQVQPVRIDVVCVYMSVREGCVCCHGLNVLLG